LRPHNPGRGYNPYLCDKRRSRRDLALARNADFTRGGAVIDTSTNIRDTSVCYADFATWAASHGAHRRLLAVSVVAVSISATITVTETAWQSTATCFFTGKVVRAFAVIHASLHKFASAVTFFYSNAFFRSGSIAIFVAFTFLRKTHIIFANIAGFAGLVIEAPCKAFAVHVAGESWASTIVI